MHRLPLVYGILLTIHTAGLLLEVPLAATMTKPLLVPCLAGLVWLEQRTLRVHGLIVAALFFSWLGDMLLMRKGEVFLMGGLTAFLSAHVCYVWIFSREATLHPLRALPFLMYAALLLVGPLNGKLPESMRVPLYTYITVITIMGVMASFRNFQRPGYELILIGSILFILSDSFLALNKFSSPLPLAGFG